MQDTPQFDQIKRRFTGYTKDQIIGGNGPQPITAPDVDVIEEVFVSFPAYFSDNAFRGKLTQQARQTIESQIQATCDQFDQIVSARANGTLPQNLASFISNISSYYEEFKNRFLYPKRIETLEGGTDTHKIVKGIEQTSEEAKKKLQSIEQVLQISQDLATQKGATELANYFHRLYDGNDIDPDEPVKPKSTQYRPTWKDWTISALLLLTVTTFLPWVWRWIGNLEGDTKTRVATAAVLVMGAFLGYAGYRLSRRFNEQYTGGYKRSAALWFIGVFFALLATGIYSFFTIKSLNISSGQIQIEEAIIKAVLLLAPIYFVRFCIRNFNANKHLAATNLHRATSIRIFEAFIQRIDDSNREVYSEMARLMFQIDETGFITRKDGAGATDGNIEIPIISK